MASLTDMPRTILATMFAFFGAMRAERRYAFMGRRGSYALFSRSYSSGCFATVTLEFGRPGEFTEFVSHHLFRHVDRRELFSVVDSEGKANELRWDIAVASPRLDDLLFPTFDHSHDFLHELLVDVRAFAE